VTMNHVPLTVIVPAGNRKDVIEDCLRSARWADELLVVDSYTTDGTLEIAQKYADRIIQNGYNFSAEQKNWAIPQASHEWVMILDTDERISPQLREEILSIISSGGACNGYRIPRLNYFLGKPVLHTGYYPDYQLRLFKRDHGRYSLRRVHAHVDLGGSMGTLHSPIIHYAHQTIDQTLKNLLILMTTWEGEQRREKVANRGIWLHIVFRPIAAFLLRYVWQGGWRDGYRGLILSVIWGMYVSIAYMKIWESNLDLAAQWWEKDWEQYNAKESTG
jgi:glycosyltransferase involved in cell wall biosynthesis